MRCYFAPSITFVRQALPMIAMTLLLSNLLSNESAEGQSYHFDTRYQPLEVTHPLPSATVQQNYGTPWQHEQVIPQPFLQPGQSFYNPGFTNDSIVTEFPMDLPAVQAPMTHQLEIDSAPPASWSQPVPEGYDPAYPIEFPGQSYQGYYPIDGNIIAPPNASSAEPPSSSQPPTIPGFIEGDISDGAVNENDSATGGVEISVDEKSNTGNRQQVDDFANKADESGAESQSKPESKLESVEQNAASDQADRVSRLELQMREAELSIKEAEEKAVAIARQSASKDELLDQLKTRLAESNGALKKVEAELAKTKQRLADSQQKLADAAGKTVTESDNPATELTQNADSAEMKEDAVKLEVETEPDATTVVEPEASASSMIQLDGDQKVEDDSARKVEDSSSNESSESEESKALEPEMPKRKTLREKIADLEAAREKQLASAAERIESDFQKKIDAKLDSGKTEQHPEVRLLKESRKERLNDSNGKIRRRYQRQINRLWKEAAARSKS
jgi:hypothetical protein